MADKRIVEVFSAGCALCESTVSMVNEVACPSCEVVIVDLQTDAGRQRAAELGVRSVPAVAIDGKLAGCCTGSGVDQQVLATAGLGRPK